MYLDTLPTEVSQTILKYVFLDADSKDDEDSDEASKLRQQILSLSMLISDDSPFREVVSQLSLSGVELTGDFGVPTICIDNGLLLIGPELFEDEGLEPGIPERIFELKGKSVKHVSMYVYGDNFSAKATENNRIVQKFVTLVKRHCPNVENLCFMLPMSEDIAPPLADIVPGLLEQFSPQLRSIEWNRGIIDPSRLRLPDISMCTRIQKLDFPASPQLTSFLSAFGASLESLMVKEGEINEYPEMLDVIEQKCRKLSTVLLFDCSAIIETVGEERYVTLLCSFGPQLVSAVVERLCIQNLGQVVRTCPNLLIRDQVVNKRGINSWEHVNLLGSMVKRLTVAVDMCYDEKCEEAISKCTNLESLSIAGRYTDEEQGIERCSNVTFLLSLSSPSLTSLVYFDFTATQQNVCTVSSAFRNLHHLTLNLVKPIESGTDFKIMARSNPQLNSVCIQEFNDGDEKREKHQSMEILRMLVRAFSKCQSVNFTLVNDEEQSVTRDEIRDICGSLPCRGVYKSVTVGSAIYLQTG